MRADAFGPAGVTGLAGHGPRRSLHRGEAAGAALAGTENTVRRWRAGPTRQATAGIEPAAAWQVLRGKLLRNFT